MFCQNVLTDDTVRDLLDENFVFWSADVSGGDEAPALARAFGLREFPAVLAVRARRSARENCRGSSVCCSALP